MQPAATLSTGVILFALAISIGVECLFVISLRKALEKCSPASRAMEPGMLWLLVIPILNVVWNFVVVNNMSKSLANEFRLRGIPNAEAEPGKMVGLAMAAAGAAAWIPKLIPSLAAIGTIAGLVFLVLFVMYWIKINGYSRLLGDPTPAYVAPGYPATGYPAAGYPQAGVPQAGYPAYPATAVPQAGYPAYPATGAPVPGYPAPGVPVAVPPAAAPAAWPQNSASAAWPQNAAPPAWPQNPAPAAAAPAPAPPAWPQNPAPAAAAPAAAPAAWPQNPAPAAGPQAPAPGGPPAVPGSGPQR